MKKYTEGGALLGMFMPIPSVAVTQSRATVLNICLILSG